MLRGLLDTVDMKLGHRWLMPTYCGSTSTYRGLAPAGSFNQEKALVGAFSVIVKLPSNLRDPSFEALVTPVTLRLLCHQPRSEEEMTVIGIQISSKRRIRLKMNISA